MMDLEKALGDLFFWAVVFGIVLLGIAVFPDIVRMFAYRGEV